MDDNKIVITDNNGEENVFKILFTYEDEENGNKYVMYYSEEDDEQIFASRYDDDDNHLYDIEDPAEWERLEEVLEDFNMHDEEETDDKCDGCVCEDGDCVTDCSECDKN